jgi:cyclohexadieny/prephenate dehydrogenase
MPYRQVALVGLGLIASSISHAMRRAGMPARITGYARSEATRREAAALGLAEVFPTAGEAVAGADLVILCTPVGAMAAIAAEIAPHLAPGATVTDVGSVKREVIDAVAPHLPAFVRFIPAHPLAGTEQSGPAAGFASLFDNRWCLLTPAPDVDLQALAELRAFWEALGARVELMDADHHDLVLAVTSHVPHLIAFTVVGVADDLSRVTASEVINYSAAGFRDFTRIAASDPTMWRDVFLANKDATLEILGRFTEELFALQRAIRLGDGPHLHAYFSRTREIRRGIIEAGQDTPAPNFGRGGETAADEAGLRSDDGRAPPAPPRARARTGGHVVEE